MKNKPSEESNNVKLPLIDARIPINGNFLGRKKLTFVVICFDKSFLKVFKWFGFDTSQAHTIKFSVKSWETVSEHKTCLLNMIFFFLKKK